MRKFPGEHQTWIVDDVVQDDGFIQRLVHVPTILNVEPNRLGLGSALVRGVSGFSEERGKGGLTSKSARA